MLAAVRAGRLWLNVLRIDRADERIRPFAVGALRRAHRGRARRAPGHPALDALGLLTRPNGVLPRRRGAEHPVARPGREASLGLPPGERLVHRPQAARGHLRRHPYGIPAVPTRVRRGRADLRPAPGRRALLAAELAPPSPEPRCRQRLSDMRVRYTEQPPASSRVRSESLLLADDASPRPLDTGERARARRSSAPRTGRVARSASSTITLPTRTSRVFASTARRRTASFPSRSRHAPASQSADAGAAATADSPGAESQPAERCRPWASTPSGPSRGAADRAVTPVHAGDRLAVVRPEQLGGRLPVAQVDLGESLATRALHDPGVEHGPHI